MSVQGSMMERTDWSFTVINACYALTEQYRSLLASLGHRNDLTENEMLVLVHLALNPEACTQKKLQSTNLNLSVSSVCRMVEGLRKKAFLTTELDAHDRRSWLIHLTPEGQALAEEFRTKLHDRLEEIFSAIPGFDTDAFVTVMASATSAAQQRRPQMRHNVI